MPTRRYVVVFSPTRYFRDRARHRRCGPDRGRPHRFEQSVALGRLSDPAKIGAAADRVLRYSPVARCFTTTIKKGSFSWDFDEKARRYDEELLCGRYVITTSLKASEASAARSSASTGASSPSSGAFGS